MQTSALAGWWGYAEGDPTVVGVVTALVVVAAVIFVVHRIRRPR